VKRVWPMRRWVKTVSTDVRVVVKMAMRGKKFFNWANSFFVVDWSRAYKGRNVGFWEKCWGKNTWVTSGCLGSNIDSVIAWDALMTRDPNEGDVVVVFMECGYVS